VGRSYACTAGFREHLVEQVPVSELCEKHHIHPTLSSSAAMLRALAKASRMPSAGTTLISIRSPAWTFSLVYCVCLCRFDSTPVRRLCGRAPPSISPEFAAHGRVR